MRDFSFGRALYELLSSMRFAISLLVIIAIAAVVGTVLLQNQPYTDYIVLFGEFWFKPFEAIGLFDVYHAGWFLAMLAFLVTSTSLCIYRHTPGIVRDIRHYREKAAVKSLRAMAHKAEYAFAGDKPAAAQALADWFGRQGYRAKLVEREDGLMLSAKKGSLQRLGYVFAHTAIVVICIGGLLDGNVPLKLAQMTGSKVIETRNLPASQIAAKSRLSPGNLSFRANIDLPEGSMGDVAFLNSGRGYFVQDLPFVLKLKQFHIEHYTTGQPKLFASDIEVTDKATGKVVSGTVQVNHPLVVDGIAIYQSSFGDGGSPIQFTLWNWSGQGTMAEPFKGTSQNTLPITRGGRNYTLEFGDFRTFNIENTDQAPAPGSKGMDQRLEDAREVKAKRHVKNVGPSIQFKVRDAQGQAREYLNYLAPFELDGSLYLLSGMRTEPTAPFSYFRIPLDGDLKPDTFMRFRAMLMDSSSWHELTQRAASRLNTSTSNADIRQGLEQGLYVVLQHYAHGGDAELEDFIAKQFTPDRQEGAKRATGELLRRIAMEAMMMAQERAGQPVPDFTQVDEKRDTLLLNCMIALSDSFAYGSDFYLQPLSFTQVQSSG
ncbi:MAG: cytochrome c biogenesis protein ResB, partial [Burkholderiales bacterium]|nr:cytochrome c biogenesis protein ResB [Burkholderiales bacterium]